MIHEPRHDHEQGREQDWDLIVVGAGSAGAALAARSAAKGKRVLLLEAGPDHRSSQLSEVWRLPNPLRALGDPAAGRSLLQQGLTARRTEVQPPLPYLQGRGVGGSSTVNGQIAIRPPMEDFDDWARAGCTGWSPRDVLPYFARLEDDAQYGGEPGHGRGGPIPVTRTPAAAWGAVDRALYETALAAGYGWAPDVNAPGATGVSPYPVNSRGGRRVTTNDGYLEPQRENPLLTIRCEATVDRVLLSGRRATGVRYLTGGRVREARADRVVLSAGAVHSPAILQRSGIGPADGLRALGIAPVVDLPVGAGLQDHPLSIIGLPLAERWAAGPDDRYTNVCVRYTSGGPGGQPNDMMFVACNQNVLALAGADTGRGAGAVLVWVNQVYARGQVVLRSADPTALPFLDQRMLSDVRDLQRLRDGVRALLELARARPVAELGDGRFDEVNAELLAVVDDDRALDGYLLRTAADGQHPTSSCRMGDPADPATVVDPGGRVLGTEGLYVADASVLPSCPRSNTNLVSIMVGELTADRLD
ncbi:GMC family oxidoreductase [Streptomyces tsukubensis]|uniref:GMC family oxidoreductase n=1 Tax=Streptomyces tsukubensis TaxID=83656 RepID=UPI0036ACC615